MKLFDFFKKKEQPAKSLHAQDNVLKEDIIKMILEQQSQRSPSEQFASGAVFDISRQQREAFWQMVRSNDVKSLWRLFANAYDLFLGNPGIVGFSPNMVNPDHNDTDPRTWNVDIFNLSNRDYVAMCFMPIQHETFAARIVGILFSDTGDGYYYCMLNKDESISSDVLRNKAIYGVEKIGEVKGLGFELMNDFLDCIKKDYYPTL